MPSHLQGPALGELSSSAHILLKHFRLKVGKVLFSVMQFGVSGPGCPYLTYLHNLLQRVFACAGNFINKLAGVNLTARMN